MALEPAVRSITELRRFWASFGMAPGSPMSLSRIWFFRSVGELGAKVVDEQLPQPAHLILRPPPVFSGERVQGQRFDAELAGSSRGATYRVGPGLVTIDRLRCRACAQRPLPSMMIATWRGSSDITAVFDR